jgi:thiamine biosynthesis protein ThiC
VARDGIATTIALDENAMTTTQMKNALTRESILELLTDAEVAKVSRAEDAPQLVEGDEYVDLEDLASGVRLVQATSRATPRHVLPRSAVSDATWERIVHAVAR